MHALIPALFPGLDALVSLYGLIFGPSQIEEQIAALSGMLPAETQQELRKLVEASAGRAASAPWSASYWRYGAPRAA
jgi:membrane protein